MQSRIMTGRTILPGIALSLLAWSCASAPAPVSVPSDHPASPGAEAAPFTPPVNPFAGALSVPPAPESMPMEMEMDHGEHQENGEPQRQGEHQGHGEQEHGQEHGEHPDEHGEHHEAGGGAP